MVALGANMVKRRRVGRRDFIKMGLGSILGAALCWAGAVQAEKPAPVGRPQAPRWDPFLCLAHLGHTDLVYGEYVDSPLVVGVGRGSVALYYQMLLREAMCLEIFVGDGSSSGN